jgi:hypothetical protein
MRSTPTVAVAQQPDTAKLKADAQNVVSIIKGDKAKAQTYCQILNLGDELDDVDEQKDRTGSPCRNFPRPRPEEGPEPSAGIT